VTQKDLAQKLELMVTGKYLTAPEVHAQVAAAMEYQLAGICVSPVWVARIATMLRSIQGISLCASVGFPDGTSKSTIKAIEATSSIKDGATEIAVVPHLPNLIKQDIDSARTELMEIVRAARATRRDVFVRVFIEAPKLITTGGETAIESACRAVRESGCDGVISSTEASTSPELIGLIRKYAQALTITAAGAIDDAASAIELLRAGADRVMSQQAIEMLESDAQV
jgi:deoxyribose-phosphate aldolase